MSLIMWQFIYPFSTSAHCAYVIEIHKPMLYTFCTGVCFVQIEPASITYIIHTAIRGDNGHKMYIVMVCLGFF